ncbi:MAG: hypothetical protein J7578_02880 [Chitinophagaceae bacterium]|nr:hypothetical protein [Chitinophagaceae bacterium]
MNNLYVIPLFLFQLLITIVIETLVLYLFKYHKMLACLVFASLANVVSVVVGGLVLLRFSSSLVGSPSFPWNVVLLFGAQALITEFLILKACRKELAAKKLLLPVLLMNFLSLIPLYFLLS